MADVQSMSIDILRTAIEMELEGQRLFENASGRMKHPRSKEMFHGLALQEKRHVQVIGHELNRLESGLDWSSLDIASSDQDEYPHISVFDGAGTPLKMLDPNASELEIINIGMGIEKRSIDYYRDAGSKVDDPKAREIFNWLVGEEAGHLLILKAEYDSRSGSGFYYDNMEFSLEVE